MKGVGGWREEYGDMLSSSIHTRLIETGHI